MQRWKDSGLTAAEFAAETGINAGTLQFWSYKLKKGFGESATPKSTVPHTPVSASIIELRPAAALAPDARFEIELAGGRRVRVPVNFDAAALRALLGVLEAVS